MNPEAKERIRSAIDIVDLIGASLPLRRQGRVYVALCPWHDDSRPSLQVNPDRQSWKCWVCNDGGDIFNFVMKHEGVGFREALEMLAERAGIALGPPAPTDAALPPESDKKLLFKVMAWAEEAFHRELLQAPGSESARQYLAARQIRGEAIQRFRLGFAPPQWQWLVDRARSGAWPDATLFALGLASRSEKTGQAYDRFRGRVIFPIHDSQGRSIAFGGRVLPGSTDHESAKYINSPETRLFIKSDHLYGLDLARDALQRQREVIVMEGYTDVIIARQAGIDNVTAVLGTALGPSHVRLLRRFADRVVLVLDGDEAGQRRTQEVLELFVSAQVDARIVTLPDGLDPADFILERGAEPFRALVAESVDAVEFKLRSATRGFDPVRDTHQSHAALEDILATIAKAPRGVTTGVSDAVRLREQQTLVRLARHFMVDEVELRARLASLRQSRPQASRLAAESVPERPVLNTWERELFELLIARPSCLSLLLERLDPTDLESPSARQLLNTYEQLDADGASLEFQHVLTTVESVELKYLLVELDERATGSASVSIDDRLQELLSAFERRRHDQACREWVFSLEKEQLSDEQQLDLLKDIIESQRIRQGISVPTDG